MPDKAEYYIVMRKAVPEVLLKVVQAKCLIEKEKAMSVQAAVSFVGISRSSYYKYKDAILPFYEIQRGIVTLAARIDDEPGLLALIINGIAGIKANILTINQSIPINGVANLTISLEMLSDTGDIRNLIDELEEIDGIHQVKILARE